MEDNQTMLDRLVTDERSQMLKAAIPYLPPNGRPFFAVYAKYLELTHTMRLFNGLQTSANALSLMSNDTKDGMHALSAEQPEPLEMLQDIRRYCSGDTREKLDSLVNMLSMIQMMQIMNEQDEE